jgi:hypothetical protein
MLAAADTAVPSKKAVQATYRVRRLASRPGFSNPTVASRSKPSIDSGHKAAPPDRPHHAERTHADDCARLTRPQPQRPVHPHAGPTRRTRLHCAVLRKAPDPITFAPCRGVVPLCITGRSGIRCVHRAPPTLRRRGTSKVAETTSSHRCRPEPRESRVQPVAVLPLISVAVMVPKNFWCSFRHF